jgi:SagB-type dehydrogenase family enzyme
MPAPLLLSLPPDFRLVPLTSGASGGVAIERGRLHIPLGEVGPGLREALERLAGEGGTEEDLAERVLQADGPGQLLRFHQILSDLDGRRLLCRTVRTAGGPLVTAVPFSRSAPEPRGEMPPSVVLSRFVYLRREGRSLIAESPLAHSYLILHGEAGARLASRLAGGLEVDEMDALRLLWEEGFLSAGEETDPDLLPWEFHDLLFHARSRSGRHRNRYGGTFPFQGVADPLPALKPAMSSETVELHRPDLERLMREDPPFTRVIEERRSRRSRPEGPERPVTLEELGELLYRSARVRGVMTAPGAHEISDRPYPGGGALYELEIYPVASACEGLDPGLYHYAPGDHRLERLSGMTPEARALIAAAGGMADAGPPEVLLVLAARFRRVTWKYRSMAYAGILKNVGALAQTVYLAATAMGLSACALGGGDSDLFARAAGLRYEAETSVGEIILNGRPGAPR